MLSTNTDTEEHPLPQAPLQDDDLTSFRPLTPLSWCLKAGLPAERIQTAAGVFAQMMMSRESNNDDNGIGAAILTHAKVYSFAHRFLLSELEELALQRLTQVLILAVQQQGTRETDLFPHLADAIRLIYSTTPSSAGLEESSRSLSRSGTLGL